MNINSVNKLISLLLEISKIEQLKIGFIDIVYKKVIKKSDVKHAKFIQIDDKVTYIKPKAFYDIYSIKSVYIPNKIVVIGRKSFMYCVNLKFICLPNTLKIINKNAFSNCYYLIRITIPKNVIIIKEGAFQYCDSLQSIKLTSNLKLIDTNAFSYCDSLKKIKIPPNIKIKKDSFCGCNSLEKIIISNKYFKSKTYVLNFIFGSSLKCNQVNAIVFFKKNKYYSVVLLDKTNYFIDLF